MSKRLNIDDFVEEIELSDYKVMYVPRHRSDVLDKYIKLFVEIDACTSKMRYFLHQQNPTISISNISPLSVEEITLIREYSSDKTDDYNNLLERVENMINEVIELKSHLSNREIEFVKNVHIKNLP